MTDIAQSLPPAAANRALNAYLAAAAVWIGVFLSGFVLSEPAPYELIMTGMIGIWIMLGMVIPRSVMAMFVLLILFNAGGVIATTQLTEQLSDAVLYVAVSAFLALTAVFYASVIATKRSMLAIIFNGWTAGAVVTGLAGIVGYFDVFPGSDIFTLYGRAKGMFADPNVLAPYLALPILFGMHTVMTGRARQIVLTLPILMILLLALFLSFSRAGWGLLIVCTVLLAGGLFLGNSSGRFRLRIVLMTVFAFTAVAAVVIVALQFDAVQDLFVQRARLLQDYDAARMGRFERHWAGYVKATELPLGLGPLAFGRLFGEDPHNIWLKSLYAYSWLGFAAYLTLVLLTLGGGFRILFRHRPWQPYLLCAYIVFLGHVLIGNVIDTDHWRHFYMLLGIIWGCIALEARHMRDAQKRKMVGAAGFEPTTP
ncbi:hypothetical protein [Oricola thermophila]|uniref:O-antigen ligase family protein n=1 Tax=Oricola thermophila TaxID=2742145 RepID=A0A6N1VCD1_9HYPH|nr:hypothetical protein [Oricola thermophila]QKV18328.1 hypothetical protein HTY61_07605 [Oricola thermophila]